VSTGTSTILLWLFVINLGIAFGAGLYEHRIVVPDWLAASPNSAHWHGDVARDDDTGRRFWVFVTTVPLTLLTLVNTYAAWQSTGPLRFWWLVAALAAVADRLFTFTYFIPTMVGLTNAPDSPVAVSAALRWSHLNYLRHALVLVAWLAALRAFGLLHAVSAAREHVA
jgi:hypothetical protein